MQHVRDSIIVAGLVAILCCGFYAFVGPEYIDTFYYRFAVPQQTSMIVGCSRAAQGLVPDSLQVKSHDGSEYPLLNYAFTISSSPYGGSYESAIRRKLRPDSTNGLFICEVSPLNFLSPDPRHEDAYKYEKSDYLDRIRQYNARGVNLSYFTSIHEQPLVFGFFNRILKISKTHRDGWLEQIPRRESAEQNYKRTQLSVRGFAEACDVLIDDKARWDSFESILDYLKRHGRVVAVRMPTGQEIRDMENEHFPNFSRRMEALCRNRDVAFLDHHDLTGTYTTLDGNHLDRVDARRYSVYLAQCINEYVRGQDLNKGSNP